MGDLTTFAKRLKEARQKAGLTQAELAKKADTTAATISSYESVGNIKKASLDLAMSFAKALNVSLDWLCGFDDEDESNNCLNASYTQIYLALSTILANADVSMDAVYIAPEEIMVSEESDVKITIKGRNISRFINDFYKFKDLLFDENFDDFVKKSLIEGMIKKYKDLDYHNEYIPTPF